MTVSYFIADLHLSDERPDMVRAFLRFVQEQAYQADALYILGDLFEVWVGDDLRTTTSQTVAQALKKLTQSGVPCYFICGNRDFLVGKRYCKQCGMTMLPDETIINLYGRQTMLLHGDIMCTLDESYQKFRRMVHRRWVQWLFLHLPKRARANIANRMRANSKRYNQSKSDNIMDVTPEQVTTRFKHYQLDWMIHGHTHRPAIHHPFNDNSQQRIVLGDWYEHSSVLTVTPEHADLSGAQL
ncbi:UDP-2,3-diacylglucosamine diphosphatase [Celerinatantimonas yamalensis]|uniref:UDP-2,3-diacylglucosamine hydrolase n=1 Tax=Celerinatantimonas yamalensis TaxID=559956 RepID=A0ABW9G334_9GAMM